MLIGSSQIKGNALVCPDPVLGGGVLMVMEGSQIKGNITGEVASIVVTDNSQIKGDMTDTGMLDTTIQDS